MLLFDLFMALIIIPLADTLIFLFPVLSAGHLLYHTKSWGLSNLILLFPSQQAHQQTLTNVRLDIMKSLSLYYYTFVDLLDLKDHTYELLTVMDALHMQSALDIVSIWLTHLSSYNIMG